MAANKPHYTLKALSVSAGMGGSWYDGSVTVRWQPWAAPDARWVAMWKGFAGVEYQESGCDRKHLALVVPFTFTLRRSHV